MNTRTRYLALILSIIAFSCVQELDIIDPRIDFAFIDGTNPVPDSVKIRINGVYEVVEGIERFGNRVVLHWDGDDVSLFAGKNAAYMILRGGVRDTGFYFSGYWRFAQDVSTGGVVLAIPRDEGGRELLVPGSQTKHVIGGTISLGNGPHDKPLRLRFLRPLRERPGGFWNIAHRGGGRNSDRHPFSENSIPMILFAGKLGANGIEVDIRGTKDGVPILFHDEEFSTRLVQGIFFAGPVSNYTYSQIDTYARLVHGEKIPTLDEALDAVVEKTNLSLVWLDVKDPSLTGAILSLIRKHTASARARNRDLEILFGIPSADIKNAFLADPGHVSAASLCELEPDDAREIGSSVWAPRWTLGTLNEEVARMHAENRRSFVWTLDLPSFISAYLRDGDFDGILTNYPTLVAYYHHAPD